jgi:dTDP-4-dehydrorhamnose 3,5-epimerase
MASSAFGRSRARGTVVYTSTGLSPEGFLHGFCVLSETERVTFMCTDLYAEDETEVAWSDSGLRIGWPISDPVVSEKDRRLRSLKALAELLGRR